MNLIISAKVLYILTIATLSTECAGLQCISDGNPCCAASWNEIQKKCNGGCQHGYFGKICNQKCRYPNYGYLCQQQCTCPETSCHFADGCLKEGVKKCSKGFHGKSCTIPCRYPNFGQLCQELCDCSKEKCNHIRGCVQRKGCRPGYFGFRCDFKCRYPNFGKYCQERCDCLKNECDNVLGCTEKEKSFHLMKKARSKQAPSVSVASVTSVLPLILVILGVMFWFYKFRIRTWINKRREDGFVHRNEVPKSKPISCIETKNQDRASFRYFSTVHVKRQNPNSDTRNAPYQLDVSNLYDAVEYPASADDDSRSAPYPMPSFISSYSTDDNELLIPID